MRKRLVSERAITRAEEARLTIDALRDQVSMLRRALDRVAVGIVVINREGDIVVANETARELIRQTRVVQPQAGHRQSVNQVIECIARFDDGAPISRTIEVGGELDRIHLFSAPLDSATERSRTSRIIFLCNPARRLNATEHLLRELYQFTGAEAKLVLELVNGRSIDEASETLHITLNTARSHLKKVFAKTQTKKQGEVIRLVTSALAAVDLS
jgi:DNA-binding CsgD family transcriptional regulator